MPSMTFHKTLSGVILAGGVTALLVGFISASPFLNGNLFIKKWAAAGFTGIYSLFLFGILCWKKYGMIIRIRITDIIILCLFLIYWYFSLLDPKNSLGIPLYLMLLFMACRMISYHMDAQKIKALAGYFPAMVRITIGIHILIVILQRFSFFPALHGYFNNGSTFGNPDMLGAYIGVLLPMSFYNKRQIRNYWPYVTGIAAIMLLIIIQARSALVALTVVGIIWLLRNKSIPWWAMVIIVMLFIALLVLLIYWHPGSLSGRIFVWFISLVMMKENPLGWGLYAFDRHYLEAQASYLAKNPGITTLFSPDIVHSPFNEFLNIGVSLGIPGLLLYILLIIFLLHKAYRYGSLLIYPLMVFLIISLTYFPFKIMPVMILIVPMTAILAGQSKPLMDRRISAAGKNVVLVLLMLCSVSLILHAAQMYQNHNKWEQAVRMSQHPHLESRAQKLFSELYPKMKTHGRFLITYAGLEYHKGEYAEALKLLEEARRYFCDVSLALKLARLYEQTGHFDQAEKHYDLAVNIAPQRFNAHFEKLLFLVRINEYKQAYQECIKLYNKPIQETAYADAYIIKKRVIEMIRQYEENGTMEKIKKRGRTIQ